MDERNRKYEFKFGCKLLFSFPFKAACFAVVECKKRPDRKNNNKKNKQ